MERKQQLGKASTSISEFKYTDLSGNLTANTQKFLKILEGVIHTLYMELFVKIIWKLHAKY